MRSPRGVTIDHVAKSAGEYQEDENQEDEWWHTGILYLLVYMLDTLFAFNGLVIWSTFHTLFSRRDTLEVLYHRKARVPRKWRG
jgi:hypothetical protein